MIWCCKYSHQLRWLPALMRGLIFSMLMSHALWSGSVVRVDSMRMSQETSLYEIKGGVGMSASYIAELSLSSVDTQKSIDISESGALQIGVARVLNQASSISAVQQWLKWESLPTGHKVMALQLRPVDGYGVRMGVVFERLPAEAVLRLYASAGGEAILQTTGAALLEQLVQNVETGFWTWWTPDISEAPVLEILLPRSVLVSELQFSIPLVSQIVISPEQRLVKNVVPMAAGSQATLCTNDVNCQSELLDQRNAVLRMAYVINGRTLECTGTLINNSRFDMTPYVLTAAHCIQDAEVASTVQTGWFYYSQSCTENKLFGGYTERYGGARWLASSLQSDMTLLQLMDAPPSEAVFAGWDASLIAVGQAVAGIHHPRGNLQKINNGTLQDYAACSVNSSVHNFSCTSSSMETKNFYRVTLQSGSIEPGCSGSALFVNGRVTGTLTGGDYLCQVKAPLVVYGRFDLALHDFQQWLGAQNSVEASRAPVYQFYIPQSGANFYTISAQERDAIIGSLAETVSYEGVAFKASLVAQKNLLPVHRFFNTRDMAHFYTANELERNAVDVSIPQFRYEAIAFWVPIAPSADTIAVYRFYRLAAHTHHYVQGEEARDTLLGNPNYGYDGLAYYVWARP